MEPMEVFGHAHLGLVKVDAGGGEQFVLDVFFIVVQPLIQGFLGMKKRPLTDMVPGQILDHLA